MWEQIWQIAAFPTYIFFFTIQIILVTPIESSSRAFIQNLQPATSQEMMEMYQAFLLSYDRQVTHCWTLASVPYTSQISI